MWHLTTQGTSRYLWIKTTQGTSRYLRIKLAWIWRTHTLWYRIYVTFDNTRFIQILTSQAGMDLKNPYTVVQDLCGIWQHKVHPDTYGSSWHGSEEPIHSGTEFMWHLTTLDTYESSWHGSEEPIHSGTEFMWHLTTQGSSRYLRVKLAWIWRTHTQWYRIYVTFDNTRFQILWEWDDRTLCRK